MILGSTCFYSNVRVSIMVAEQDNKIVAYIVSSQRTETSGRIISVGVLKKYLCQGIGSILVSAMYPIFAANMLESTIL
jgi:ribosomal protein S18 acetylase RimI-like enzyme